MSENEPSSTKWHLDPETGELIDPDDAPELTEEWFARADFYDGGKLVRRGTRPETELSAVELRLSADVLAYFQAQGPDWERKLDYALVGWIENQRRDEQLAEEPDEISASA